MNLTPLYKSKNCDIREFNISIHYKIGGHIYLSIISKLNDKNYTGYFYSNNPGINMNEIVYYLMCNCFDYNNINIYELDTYTYDLNFDLTVNSVKLFFSKKFHGDISCSLSIELFENKTDLTLLNELSQWNNNCINSKYGSKI